MVQRSVTFLYCRKKAAPWSIGTVRASANLQSLGRQHASGVSHMHKCTPVGGCQCQYCPLGPCAHLLVSASASTLHLAHVHTCRWLPVPVLSTWPTCTPVGGCQCQYSPLGPRLPFQLQVAQYVCGRRACCTLLVWPLEGHSAMLAQVLAMALCFVCVCHKSVYCQNS